MAIGSVSNYLKQIKQLGRGGDCLRFFRGQANCNWTLMPSILRQENIWLKNEEINLLKNIEIHYPDIFRECESSFEKWVIAQNYGVPTRLLDMTTNPLVALYFACYKKEKKSGNSIVYVLDLPKTKVVYYDDTSIDEIMNNGSLNGNQEEWIGVRAKMNNPRMASQNGAYIIFGKANGNKQCKLASLCKSIEISASHIKNILDDLSCIGISRETMFPELAQYAKELCERKSFI